MTGFVPSNRPHGFRVDSDDLPAFSPSLARRNGGLLPEVGTRTETRTIPEQHHGPTEADLRTHMAVASAKFDITQRPVLPPSTSAKP